MADEGLELPDWATGDVSQDDNGLLTAPLVDLSEYKGNYGLVTDLDVLKALLDKLGKDGKPIAFDIETGYLGMDAEKRSLDVHNLDQMIVGFSITNGVNWARYIPLHHDDTDLNLDPNLVWPMVKDLFEAGVADLVAHSFQFEGRNLRVLDLKGDGPDIFPARVHDTQLQSYVIGQAPPFGMKWHGLKQLTSHWFNYDQTELPDLCRTYAPKDKKGNPKFTKKDENALRFNRLPLDFAVQQYVCDDVTWCLRLDQFQRPNIEQNAWFPTANRMYRLELEILDLLIEMSQFGISVDWTGLEKGREDYQVFIANMQKTARGMLADLVNDDFATAFNFRSVPQVQRLLFSNDYLGLRPTQFTDGGQGSTKDSSLEAIRKQHPIVDMILKLRQVEKMGQWFEQWNGYRTTHDDKIHPALNQTRVQSGRFASDNPNVQNITKKWWYTSVPRDWSRYPANEQADDEFEAYVEEHYSADNDYWTGNARSFLVASPGWRLLSFDYAQQELRVLAGLSKEPYLIQAFADGVDIHKATAAMMFNTPIDEVTKLQRQRGKAQPLDAKVLTPTGYRLMGDLQVGDMVIGSDGFPTKITGVFPQGLKPVYRVETTDGSTECCGEHLWTVKNAISGGGKWVTKPLEQLVSKGLKLKTNQPKWMLPERPVIQYDSQPELPIDPYVLGLLLGDGTFRHTWAPAFGSADPELLDAVESYHLSIGGTVTRKQRKTENFWSTYLAAAEYEGGARNVVRNPLRLKLRELGLDNVIGQEKFVPEQYLHASPADRLALLRGLLDTDGNVLASGAQFRNISKDLAEAVQSLARSLGGSASLKLDELREHTGEDGVFHSRFPLYKVYLRMPAELCPFRLERKINKLKPVKYGFNLRILDAVPVGEKECQCISVENADGLYITDNEIVTHNTINFALIYGQGPSAMADSLGISMNEAKALMSQYFSAFTNVGAWMTETKMQAGRKGYVTSFYGRRSTLWELFSDNEAIRSKAERKMVNIPVQGGGADISKLAMIRARKVLRENGWWGEKVRMLMNQHDSLVFEVRDDMNLNDVVRILEPAVMLVDLPELKEFPPMEVDWEVGLTWGGVHKFDWGEQEEEDPTTESVRSLPTITKTTTPGGAMQVRFTQGTFSVELTDADGETQFGGGWDGMSVLQRFGKLSALAELLGSDYLFKHNELEKDEYMERVQRLMPVIKEAKE